MLYKLFHIVNEIGDFSVRFRKFLYRIYNIDNNLKNELVLFI